MISHDEPISAHILFRMTLLKAGSLDERGSRNVDQFAEPTHWNPKVISPSTAHLHTRFF